MYTPLDEAKEEVWKRWNDADLRRRVQEYVKEVPQILSMRPKAVMWRQVASPNFESYAIVEASKKIGLKPLCLEYNTDKFCTRNSDKVLLGKMVFYNGTGKNGGQKPVTTAFSINFEECEMKRFDEIQTIWGKSFIDFHHCLMERHLSDVEFIDHAQWVAKIGRDPMKYYDRFLALFICHGILFENFLLEGSEGQFTRDIAWPAIRKVTDHFGLKPLIVRLLPEESEADPYWCWYPGHLEEEVRRLMAGGAVGNKQG